jgi:hypothetical protein
MSGASSVGSLPRNELMLQSVSSTLVYVIGVAAFWEASYVSCNDWALRRNIWYCGNWKIFQLAVYSNEHSVPYNLFAFYLVMAYSQRMRVEVHRTRLLLMAY